MYTFLMTIHVSACVLLIMVVLLQAGRGAGLQVFGGGGGDALFSAPSSNNFMKQFTGGLAVTFAVTSLLLTLISGRAGLRSVTADVPAAPVAAGQAPPPAAPQQAAPAPQAPASSGGSPKGPAPAKK